MAANFNYASFPNSRNKQRSATNTATTYQTNVVTATDQLLPIAFANLNRTYITITNLSSVEELIYLYVTVTAINPMVVPSSGNPNDLLYDAGGDILYQKEDFGVTTNWQIVDPRLVCEFIPKSQSVTLLALGAIYGGVNTATPATTVAVAVDEGQG